jgi:uncharacterized protein (DUF2147 family)
MKQAQFFVLMAFIAVGAIAADDPNAVVGRWASKDSIIEVAETNGTLHATIIAILNPVYKAGEDGPVGTTKVDLKNPEAGLRARPIVGMDLLSDYAFKDGKWQGNLYDPESGKTYKSQITVSSDGKLQMRGYIGSPMLGRTQAWTKASTCTGDVPKMLASVNLNSCG